MGKWDYDEFARGEGFRSGKHRDDFYAGRESDADACMATFLLLPFYFLRALWRAR